MSYSHRGKFDSLLILGPRFWILLQLKPHVTCWADLPKISPVTCVFSAAR